MRSFREVLRGNLLIFILGDLMRQLSMFITFPYFSLYIQALGGSTVAIGLVNSLLPLTALFIYPIAGFLADRYSRVKIIAITGYITAALYSVFVLAPDWKFLALGNFLLGLIAFTFPAMNALIADSLPPQRRGIGYSLWMAIPGAVGILSPYIGGYLITKMGIEQAMRFLYGLTVVTAIVIATMDLKFLRETQKGEGVIEPGRGLFRILSESYRDMFQVLRWLPRSLKAFAMMLILNFFINNLTGPYWIIYGMEKIGLKELQWGTVLLVAAIVNVVLLVPAGIIVDKFGAKKVLSLALTLLALPVFLFPFSRSIIDTILLYIAMTIANAFLISGAPSYMASLVPNDRRGSVMAALGQGTLSISIRGGIGGPGMGAILTIPSILGSIIGGFIYRHNPVLPWVLLATSLVFNAGFAIFFLSSPENETV